MALIDCPECKSKISDSATSCPHCGFPILHLTQNGVIHFLWQGTRGDSIRKTRIVIDGFERATLHCGEMFHADVTTGIHTISLYQGHKSMLQTSVFIGGDATESFFVFKETIGFTHPKLKQISDTSEFFDYVHNVPRCPTCGSTRVKRIAYAKKNLSVGMFGSSSNLINKTFECENCKYTW